MYMYGHMFMQKRKLSSAISFPPLLDNLIHNTILFLPFPPSPPFPPPTPKTHVCKHTL